MPCLEGALLVFVGQYFSFELLLYKDSIKCKVWQLECILQRLDIVVLLLSSENFLKAFAFELQDKSKFAKNIFSYHSSLHTSQMKCIPIAFTQCPLSLYAGQDFCTKQILCNTAAHCIIVEL